MFQRYEIVIDYEQRLKLPPPLTVISYVIMLFKWIFNRQNFENVNNILFVFILTNFFISF